MKKFNKGSTKWIGTMSSDSKSSSVNIKAFQKGEMQTKQDTNHKTIDASKQPSAAFDLKFPSLTLIVGMTDSGKSTLVSELSRQMMTAGKVDRIVVLCPTSDLQPETYYFISKNHPENLITNPTDELIQEILEQQKQSKLNGTNIRSLLILDDVIGENMKFKSADVWKKVATSVRHYNMSVLLLLQNISGEIPPILKDAASTIFVTNARNRDLEQIYNLQNNFTNNKLFRDYVNENTDNYGVVRFNIRSKDGTRALARYKPVKWSLR